MPKSLRLAVFILILLLAGFSAVFAEGEKIAEIVVSGNRRIDTAAILAAIKFKAGDTLFSDKTDEDLRAIYKLGHFQEVRVATRETDKGVVLIYTVLEKPVVRDIKFEGNKELTIDKLTKDGLEIHKNTIFSTKDLNKSVAKIKKLYGDDGYYLAEVTPLIDKRSPSEMVVTFKIDEGKKIQIRSITFDGNNAFNARKLRGFMETKEKWFLSWLTGAGTYKEEVLNNDAMIIADQYMNNGYINIKVGEPKVKLTDAKDALEVSIGITEGDQFRMNEISFKGDLLEPASELRKKLKSEQGAIFSRAVMRTDIGTLTDLYGDKGFAFANVNPLTKTDAAKKTVDVVFDMEKGELVYIDRIAVAGNPKTRDKVVRREMRVIEGETFSATGMKRSKQNLMNTGYFEEANISTAKTSASNKLNVNVDVKEKPTGTFSIGGGYSSLDGIIGQGSVQQANFLGLGLKANVSAAIGGISQTYSIGLNDPYFLDSKWYLGADIYRSERIYIDYSRRVTGGDIKTGHPLSDFVSLFFMYKYEIKDLYNPQPAYLQLNNDPIFGTNNFPLGTSSTSSILGSISHNNTDYRLDPTTGLINSLTLEYAGPGGTNKFARYTTEHTWFYPLYKKLIFSTKLTMGYIQEMGRPIPIDEKFYLGGIFSLRGYKDRTVSPTQTVLPNSFAPAPFNPQVVYLGGDKEYFGNFEITYPILADLGIKLVTFFDYGNSFTNMNKAFSTTSSPDGGILMSYGAGIRWASPMGPLRLEYGIPLKPRNSIDNRGGRLEFSIGTMF